MTRIDPKEIEWQDDALCAQTNPEAFFPERGNGEKEAKAICARCPVVEECLAYALKHREDKGIWGGLTENERKNVSQPRRKAPRKPKPQLSDRMVRDQKILQLNNDGVSAKELAERFGLGIRSIYRITADQKKSLKTAN